MDFLQFGPSLSLVPLPLPSLQIILFHAALSTALRHIHTSVLPTPVILQFLTACTRKAAVGFISGIKAEC